MAWSAVARCWEKTEESPGSSNPRGRWGPNLRTPIRASGRGPALKAPDTRRQATTSLNAEIFLQVSGPSTHETFRTGFLRRLARCGLRGSSSSSRTRTRDWRPAVATGSGEAHSPVESPCGIEAAITPLQKSGPYSTCRPDRANDDQSSCPKVGESAGRADRRLGVDSHRRRFCARA
jgi:hypothetical protein